MDKKFKLPRKFAEKWLAALRSGKYKQTDGTLYNPEDDGYCCLGVACRVEYPLSYLESDSDINNGYASVIHKSPWDLKKDLEKIPVELKGIVSKNDLVRILTELNDTCMYSFNQIADWIEQNVEFYG